MCIYTHISIPKDIFEEQHKVDLLLIVAPLTRTKLRSGFVFTVLLRFGLGTLNVYDASN